MIKLLGGGIGLGNASGSLLSRSKSISIEDPTNSENIILMQTSGSELIVKITSVLKGSGPSVTFSIRHGTNVNTTGTEIKTGGFTTTSTTTGDEFTSFDSGVIPAEHFVWLTTSAVTGTVELLNVTALFN
jgi:hypothetical protein